MNRVEIAGILKDAPELYEIGQPPGQSLRAEFTVILNAVRYNRRTDTDEIDKSFIRVLAWEDIAELVTPWPGGSYVHIIGELTQQEVEVARGRKERKTKVRALAATLVRRPAPAAPKPHPADNDHSPF